MSEPIANVMENSIQMAWDFLGRTGELGEPEIAARVLLEAAEGMIRQGERRPLMLEQGHRRLQTIQKPTSPGVDLIGRETMDNLKLKGSQDRSKINMREPREVQYWTKHLKVSTEQLQSAVDKVGNAAAAVRKQLTA
jgi:hypothetical protein